MKKLLALLLLCPALSFGQKFELGLNVGPALFAGTSSDYSAFSKNINPALYSSFTIAMRLNTYDITLKFAGHPLVQDGYGPYNYMIANDISEFILSGNKHIALSPKFDVYGGVSIGAIAYANADLKFMEEAYPESIITSSAGAGFVGGIQLGANYSISRRFSLNAESDAYYAHIKTEYTYDPWGLYADPPPFTISYLTFPISVGIKYKFGIGRKYSMKKQKS